MTAKLTVPKTLQAGVYYLALAVLDLRGNPALRFANRNYFRGGRHPLGLVGGIAGSVATRITRDHGHVLELQV